jgi:hypothetical protein
MPLQVLCIFHQSHRLLSACVAALAKFFPQPGLELHPKAASKESQKLLAIIQKNNVYQNGFVASWRVFPQELPNLEHVPHSAVFPQSNLPAQAQHQRT